MVTSNIKARIPGELCEKQFIEYSKEGYPATFTVTNVEMYRRWEFDNEIKFSLLPLSVCDIRFSRERNSRQLLRIVDG